MKKYFLWIFCIAAIGLQSCQKDSDSPADPQGLNGSGDITAKIDGDSWSATLDVVASFSDNTLVMGGTTLNGQTLSISAVDVSGTGTYRSSDETFVGTYIAGSKQYTSQLGIMDGVMELTTFGGRKAKGTFSFTAEDPVSGEMISVTQGTFDVEYLEE